MAGERQGSQPRWQLWPEAHSMVSAAGLCWAHSQACLGILGKGQGSGSGALRGKVGRDILSNSRQSAQSWAVPSCSEREEGAEERGCACVLRWG